ncbi:MAG TPA: nucleotidyltransferase family protein [Abditibacterium sp.]
MATPDAAFRTTLSCEAEFVLLGARLRLEGPRRARWEALLCDCGSARLDWEQVLALASSHRVMGLLGRHLSARSWRDVPLFARHAIQHYFQTTVVHCAALKDELADVSHALESAGVPVVSFKGPTLALEIYGNAVMRPSADIDLLVSRRQVGQAREILRKAGYAPEAELSPDQEQVHLRVDSVFNLSRPVPASLEPLFPQGFAVELHWAITSPCLPFELDFEAVAPRLKTLHLPHVAPEKATVRAFPAEELLLILCVHGAKHLWERLIWLCDIAELVNQTPHLDWHKVMRQAHERGVLRMTVLGLSLARDVMGTQLPPEIERWFTTQPEALHLATRLRHSLLAHSEAQSWNGTLTHNLTTDRLLMQAIDTPLHRIGFVWHLATTPSLTERSTVSLMQELHFLWWVLRPARVIRKHWLLGKPDKSS